MQKSGSQYSNCMYVIVIGRIIELSKKIDKVYSQFIYLFLFAIGEV